MLLAALLLATRLSAMELPAWYERPLADHLQPVHPAGGHRFNTLMAQAVAGPAASPLFREPLATLDVYYRFVDATGEGPLAVDPAAEAWRDLALLGAGLALEDLAWETVGRSEGLSAVVKVGRSVVSPNLVLERRRGDWHVAWNEPQVRERAPIARRELVEGMSRPTPRHPTVTLSSGLVVHSEEAVVRQRRVRTRTLDAATWIRLQRFGLDQVDLRFYPVDPHWETAARQAVLPGVTLLAVVTSRDDGLERVQAMPKQWGLGLSWRLPFVTGWSLYGRWSHAVVILPRDEPDWSASVSLRWLAGAPAPADPERWPLGQRIGAPGPLRPPPPPPSRAATWVVPPPAPGLPDLPERLVGVVDHVGVGGLLPED